MPEHDKDDIKFEDEKGAVEHLLHRLQLTPDGPLTKPNTKRAQSGADVLAVIGGQRIGVQHTDVECAVSISGKVARGRGKPRALEKKAGEKGQYAGFGENDPEKLLANIVRAIIEKTTKQMADFDQNWMLVVAGNPNAPLSTFVMTQLVTPDGLNLLTAQPLSASVFDRAFMLAILGTERALFEWNRASGQWTKHVEREQFPSLLFDELMARARRRTLGRP